MKKALYYLILFFGIVAASNWACNSGINDTGSDQLEIPADEELPLEWVNIPSGDFTYGSNGVNTNINYDYQIMKY
ncbi:MAG: hypothetical protein A2V66_15285 [Ignavibacteria bacterium RBG_13_36_8]|nr:MAG: hypothetical protein A2V66_15285 [Ignavibacteria bacterium RBG_13_36_8]